MKSAKLALQRAIGARLIQAFAAAGETCPWSTNPTPNKPFPYGVLGTDTETGAFSTKTTDGGPLTHSLRIYSDSQATAKRLAGIAVEALTDRENPLELEAPFYLADRVRLQMNEIITERDERGDTYGAAIRIGAIIGQH